MLPKIFAILATFNLLDDPNYFNDLTKLFSDLYLVKFLDFFSRTVLSAYGSYERISIFRIGTSYLLFRIATDERRCKRVNVLICAMCYLCNIQIMRSRRLRFRD